MSQKCNKTRKALIKRARRALRDYKIRNGVPLKKPNSKEQWLKIELQNLDDELNKARGQINHLLGRLNSNRREYLRELLQSSPFYARRFLKKKLEELYAEKSNSELLATS